MQMPAYQTFAAARSEDCHKKREKRAKSSSEHAHSAIRRHFHDVFCRKIRGCCPMALGKIHIAAGFASRKTTSVAFLQQSRLAREQPTTHDRAAKSDPIVASASTQAQT
jgi:hypothetical protein